MYRHAMLVVLALMWAGDMRAQGNDAAPAANSFDPRPERIVAAAAYDARLAVQVQALLDAYRTQPQGYPRGKDARGTPYAQPDTQAWFRWHFYNDGAIQRYEDAKMDRIVQPYNPLEDKGVSVDQGTAAKFSFVAEHVTEGKRSLKAEFTAEAIAAGKAAVKIGVTEGGDLHASYQNQWRTPSYWCHYRWLKLDVFNPAATEVRVRVANVPFVLRPGSSVVAVKTADAAGYAVAYTQPVSTFSVQVTAPGRDATLFIDNARLEQEVPAVIAKEGRLFQFPARDGPNTALLLWPGLTAVEASTVYSPERAFGWVGSPKCAYSASSFRSEDNGILWGACSGIETPFRADVPDGRYGICVIATPGSGFQWSKGATIRVGGKDYPLFTARTDEEARLARLSGELWDFRPGTCIWEELVRPPFYPRTQMAFAEAVDGHLLLEFPRTIEVRAVFVFPEKSREEALKELGRFNYLMAESWDVSHAWVKGDVAERARYIGFHEEASRPDAVVRKLQALSIGPEDWKRGFLLFQRGLAESVYPDTVPSAEEVSAASTLRAFASPGQKECATLGILPLATIHGLRVSAGALRAKDGGEIPAANVVLRFGWFHHKCMEYWHHNHAYNYQEHDLVKRPALNLYPGAARRAYVDIAVPADAKPGEYRGEVAIRDATGQAVAAAPIVLEVLPIALQTPPVLFGTEGTQPELLDYGLNMGTGSYDDAAANGFKAVALCPYDAAPPMVKGRRVAWQGMVKDKEFIQSLIADGRSGKGPRVLFGGLVAGQHAGKGREFVDGLLKVFPDMEITGYTAPLYYFVGPGTADLAPTWDYVTVTRGKPELLEQAVKDGKFFFFTDWVKYSKEQSARFTHGFWLWRLKAPARFTTFKHNWYQDRLACPLPYYALAGIAGGNRYGAFQESQAPGELNPSRDLLLVREGIDDYRYVFTLEKVLCAAEEKKPGGAAAAAARKFLEQLAAGLSLDLSKYYESRGGPEQVAFAENWFMRPDNPWTTARLDATRKKCAEHILALQREAESTRR